MSRSRFQDAIAGAGLSLGLLALGVCLSGNSARALSYAGEPAGPAGLQALPGSVSRGGELSIGGAPTRVRSCRTHEPPGAVLARYRALASAESGALPWVESDAPDGGLVAWVSPDGLRKAVQVVALPGGGAAYELLESDPPSARGEDRLPADLPLPYGCRLAFSAVRPDGTGTALLLAAGTPAFALGACLDALRARGFEVDERTAAALDEPGALHTVPFRAPGRSGLLTVAPAEGGARVSLTIQRG